MNDRVPPHDLHTERSVIASALSDGDARTAAVEIVTPDAMYNTAHRKIWSVLREAESKSEPVDAITLMEALRAKGWLEECGGEAYLGELMENIASSANIEQHCQILNNKAVFRKGIVLASELQAACFEAKENPVDIMGKYEAALVDILTGQSKEDYSRIGELLPAMFEDLEKIQRDPLNGIGIKTGLTPYDQETGGLHETDLNIWAGRPGMGKTGLMLSVALYLAKCGIPVGLFLLEMSKKQMTQRAAAKESGVSLHRMRTEKLTKAEMLKLGESANTINSLPLYMDDTPGVNIFELSGKARRMVRKNGVQAMFIDYLQLMGSVNSGDSRHVAIGNNSRGLKALAKRLNIPVTALSQLSRSCEQRGKDWQSKRPILSDLRESGNIEEDADMVMFCFRPEYYDKEALPGKAHLIIAKQRNGPTGTRTVAFDKETASYENLPTTDVQGHYADQNDETGEW